MTTINLDGVVGWDIEASEFASLIDNTTGDITFELNSGGGYVTDGISILNKIRAYDRGKTTANISYAASMMTQIALACDEVNVYDNAIFMIHNVQGIVVGDHNDMREAADLQERMSMMLAQLYTKKTGKSEDEIKSMMDNDTYLFGNEIKDMGFADNIINTDKQTDKTNAIDTAHTMYEKVQKAMKEEKLSISALKEQFTQCMGNCDMVVNTAVPTASSDKPANKIQGENMTIEEIMASEPYTELVASHEEQVSAMQTAHTEALASVTAQLEEANATLEKHTAWNNSLSEVCAMAVQHNVSADTLVAMVTAGSMDKAKASMVDGMESSGAFGQSVQEEDQPKANKENAIAQAAKMGIAIISKG
jgi:ATP-dependent protease ClpP protease subunit